MFFNFFQKISRKEITLFTSVLLLSASFGLNLSNVQAADTSLTWVGDSLQNGDWSVAGNWNGGDPNIPNYDATINRTGFSGVNLDQNFDIEAFNFNGGTLNTNTNILNVNQTFNWTNGIVSGTGGIRAAGGLELGGASGFMAFKDSAVIINTAGQVANWNSGNILMSFTGNSGFVNEAGAIFNAKVDSGSMGVLSGRGKFDNHANGFFIASLSSADQITTVNAKMNNHGTVAALNGELILSGGGASTGTFVAIGGGKINFGGGVHELQAGSSVAGESVEFGRFLGITNIEGTYNVRNTTISGGATANFNAPVSQTETLTLDGAGFSILGGSGALAVSNITTFRNGVMQGPNSGTAPPALVLANGGLTLDGPGVKVIRGERILVAGGGDASWEEGSMILVNGRDPGSDVSRGSVLFNNTVMRFKSVGGTIAGQGEVLNAGALVIELPELFEEIAGEPRKQILIKSNFTNQGALVLQGSNLLIGGELEEGNILNNTPTNRFNGNFTQTEIGITAVKIAGTDQGMEYDTLAVFETAILDGAFFIKLVDDILSPDPSAEIFKPENGDFFDLLVAGEIIDNGFVFGGDHGGLFNRSIVQLADDRWAVRATFVPIPAAVWLFISALFGLWRVRVRQSR